MKEMANRCLLIVFVAEELVIVARAQFAMDFCGERCLVLYLPTSTYVWLDNFLRL